MKFGLSQYTLDHFFKRVTDEYSARPSLALVGQIPFSYREFGHKVNKLKTTLKELGIKKQDKIVILGNSSPNWAISFMAITTMGAIAVPVLEDFPESDIDHIIKHSESMAVFITSTNYQSLNLQTLETIDIVINLDDFTFFPGNSGNRSTLLKQIHHFPEKMIKVFDKTDSSDESDTIDEEDLAEILYTSGTTGHSKGVMLTHKNLVSNLFEGPDLLKVIHDRSVILSILPLAHAFGSTSAFLSIIYKGASIYYLTKPPSPKVLLSAMQEVRPTIMGAVPLVFEKIYHKQVVPLLAKNRLMRLLASSKTSKKMLYKIVGKKVKQLLGGNLDCVIIGGASFSPEVEVFMQEGGIPYCCGYGLSECSPLVTFSSMQTQKVGSPGHAITDVRIKIIAVESNTGIGEICVKGPNVMMGYLKNGEETKKSFTGDGWFITGDRGYLDEDGYLFITGRSKNVIVGSSGENIYPEVIEVKLAESIYVEESLVYQIENQLVARIYPNYEYIESKEGTKDEQSLAAHITKILESVRRNVNENLPAFSKINRVIEQSSPFLKTPTNKIKRMEYVPGYMDNSII